MDFLGEIAYLFLFQKEALRDESAKLFVNFKVHDGINFEYITILHVFI